MIPLRNAKRFFFKTVQQPGYALAVLLRRVRARWYYAFGSGRSASPESITLFLTHRCNLRCKMCGQWGEAGITNKEGSVLLNKELSLTQLKAIVDDVAYAKPSITLFGGEPLLYPACVDVIRHIKAKAMHCLMITNGSLLENLAEQIVESGLDELNVSLDGAGQLHNEIRGMPGLFERIMLGLGKINFYKDQKSKKKPFINLQCTITKYNYRALEQMLEVARKVKANSLTYHNLIFLSEDSIQKQKAFDTLLNTSSGEWQGFVLEPGIDPLILDMKRKEILSKKYGFSVDFYPNFSCAELEGYYRNPCYSPPAQNCRCLSPWLVAYVFPDGAVRPCLNFSYSFGNAATQRFADLWNSGQAVAFRKSLKENKMFPVCVRCTELYRY